MKQKFQMDSLEARTVNEQSFLMYFKGKRTRETCLSSLRIETLPEFTFFPIDALFLENTFLERFQN